MPHKPVFQHKHTTAAGELCLGALQQRGQSSRRNVATLTLTHLQPDAISVSMHQAQTLNVVCKAVTFSFSVHLPDE